MKAHHRPVIPQFPWETGLTLCFPGECKIMASYRGKTRVHRVKQCFSRDTQDKASCTGKILLYRENFPCTGWIPCFTRELLVSQGKFLCMRGFSLLTRRITFDWVIFPYQWDISPDTGKFPL